MRALFLVILCGACNACGHPAPVGSAQLPPGHGEMAAATPKNLRRMVPPEAFLRSYLRWFGGLAPVDVQKRAHGFDLFDQWTDYLAALGLPDYHQDAPRVTQSNTMMLAAVGRLGEALCVRSVEHDLRAHPPIEQRVIFAFDERPNPSVDDFAIGFDVLHRTFLGYPADLAPADRLKRFYALYQQIAAAHANDRTPLSADEAAWAGICTALVQHPETELY